MATGYDRAGYESGRSEQGGGWDSGARRPPVDPYLDPPSDPFSDLSGEPGPPIGSESLSGWGGSGRHTSAPQSPPVGWRPSGSSVSAAPATSFMSPVSAAPATSFGPGFGAADDGEAGYASTGYEPGRRGSSAYGQPGSSSFGYASGSGYGPGSGYAAGSSGRGPVDGLRSTGSYGSDGYGPARFDPPVGVRPRSGLGASLSLGRLGWRGIAALSVFVLLIGVVGGQAYWMNQLNQRLSSANGRMGNLQQTSQQQSDTLEARVAALEQALGKTFNPEAIATAVLPSVFRVTAGDLTGTAFAVGKQTANGGTNLFTNFHVVADVFNAGGRQVTLERQNQRTTAKIVKVDQANDVAQLQTTTKITGLTVAPATVKSGQQIVVVGSPLGLEDSVTTGVVSAFRKLADSPGPVIQFDAPINPGNSGGPVINSAKQVVGIASAKAQNAEGIGLAIPISTACDEFRIC
jgi:putative serine protease PepD